MPCVGGGGGDENLCGRRCFQSPPSKAAQVCGGGERVHIKAPRQKRQRTAQAEKDTNIPRRAGCEERINRQGHADSSDQGAVAKCKGWNSRSESEELSIPPLRVLHLMHPPTPPPTKTLLSLLSFARSLPPARLCPAHHPAHRRRRRHAGSVSAPRGGRGGRAVPLRR